MKKILVILILLSLSAPSWALQDTTTPLSKYELYKNRVDKICKDKKPDEVIIQTQEYTEYKDYSIEESSENDDLVQAKVLYRENMGNIYKCALLGVQKKSINLVKEELLEFAPKTSNKIVNKLKSRQNKIELMTNKLGCTPINRDESLQKLEVLQRATYELCKHHSYLEYIRERSDDIKNNIDDKENYSVSRVASIVEQKKSDINDEIERSYKVFPLAFQAYTEYENNYSIHILLELLRDDFIVLKEELHDTINPINQVVYKISNAMQLD